MFDESQIMFFISRYLNTFLWVPLLCAIHGNGYQRAEIKQFFNCQYSSRHPELSDEDAIMDQNGMETEALMKGIAQKHN